MTDAFLFCWQKVLIIFREVRPKPALPCPLGVFVFPAYICSTPERDFRLAKVYLWPDPSRSSSRMCGSNRSELRWEHPSAIFLLRSLTIPFGLSPGLQKGQGLAAGVKPKPQVFNPRRDGNFGSGLEQLRVLQVREKQQVAKLWLSDCPETSVWHSLTCQYSC